MNSPSSSSDPILSQLRCLETGTPLSFADATLIEQLNVAIEQGSIRDQLGRSVDFPISAGLVNASGSLLYPILEDVAQLLRDESICLTQLTASEQPDA